jgi:Ca2+-binding EF-hand superfamily protein
MDWIEFRDILFPILTGRYMERHIRKFFDLFDTTKDGYLSLQEITGKIHFNSFFSFK